jgi:hypothetical protein
MKKKITAILLIIVLIGLSNHVNAQYSKQKEIDKTEKGDIELYFFWGIITGTYDIEIYNNKGYLVFENEDDRKTLRLIGVGYYFEYSEAPTLFIGSVITNKVIVVEFYGVHNNGRVFGFGEDIETIV